MFTYHDLIEPQKKQTGDKWDEVLEKAWKIRSFEIELFWKRSTYFSVLVGALFIAYYTLESGNKSPELLKALVAILGFLASCVWFFSNKGSKLWQENWELHIDTIEKLSNSNKLHSAVLNKSGNWWNFDAASYSVSKLNTLCSVGVCFSWLLVMTTHVLTAEFRDNDQDWIVIGLTGIGCGFVSLGCKSTVTKSSNTLSMSPDGTLTPTKQSAITVYHK
jgi:hypothetical protein